MVGAFFHTPPPDTTPNPGRSGPCRAADDRNQESLQAVFRAGRRAHEVVRRLLGMAGDRGGPSRWTAPPVVCLIKSSAVSGALRLSGSFGCPVARIKSSAVRELG